MILHAVLFRFVAGVSPQSEAAQSLHAALSALPEQISEIRSWQCGFNVTPDAQAADYVLLAGFDDEAALQRYFEHPAHLVVLRQAEGLVTVLFGDIQSSALTGQV